MKVLDRWLQNWRIAKARPYIPGGSRVLDIGCGDGAVFRRLGSRIREGIGIDPDAGCAVGASGGSSRFIVGWFPDDLPEDTAPFDVITMLACLEHIPPVQLPRVAARCSAALKPGGWLIITVPSPSADRLVHALMRWFPLLLEGVHVEQHHGFEPAMTPDLFPNLTLRMARTFEFGFNHLFVFQKPARS